MNGLTEIPIFRLLLTIFRRALRIIGLDVTPRRYAHNLQELVWLMEDSKIKMDVIFDIGANEGKWSRRVNEAMKRNPSFYLFEPNKGFNSKYEKLGFLNYYNVLLSDTEREVEFFGIGSTGDSYYKEIGNQLFNGLIPRKLKTISLDELREKETYLV